MGSVVAFSKQKTDGKYVIKICTLEPNVCDVQNGYYKIDNTQPKEWHFAFPSTQDNTNIFIPSRIVEDPTAFQSLVLSTLQNRPNCLKIDPCDDFAKKWCCNAQERDTQQSNNATTTNTNTTSLKGSTVLTVWFIILLILFGIALILVFALVASS